METINKDVKKFKSGKTYCWVDMKKREVVLIKSPKGYY